MSIISDLEQMYPGCTVLPPVSRETYVGLGTTIDAITGKPQYEKLYFSVHTIMECMFSAMRHIESGQVLVMKVGLYLESIEVDEITNPQRLADKRKRLK